MRHSWGKSFISLFSSWDGDLPALKGWGRTWKPVGFALPCVLLSPGSEAPAGGGDSGGGTGAPHVAAP